jgi:hypothetical protein
MKQILRASLVFTVLAGVAACEDGPTGASPPAAVSVASGGDQSAPAGGVLPQPIVVTVTDDDGDPVQGVEVRFAVTSGGGLVYPSVDSTDAQGHAGSEWRLGTVTADSQRVQVQVISRNGSVAATTTIRATAQPLAGRTLQRVSGHGQTGGANTALADSLTVRLVDELGNGVPGATVTWTVSPNGGTVSPATSTTRADGTAKTAWTLGGVTGGATVVATVPGVPQTDFGATVTSPFTFTVTHPQAGRTYGDSLPVQATATSSGGTIVRMTARVENRSVNLSAGQGTLNLAGLSEGQKSLLIWAVTSAGDSAAVQVPFVLNRAPVLTVTAPVRGTVIRTGSVRIDADCSDPSGCTRVAVYATEFPDDTPDRWTLLADGTTSFHGDVSLAAFNGRRITLVVQATDGLGGTSRTVHWPIYVENAAAWQEVSSGGFRALDVDATRILYVDSAAGQERVLVRALAGGTPTDVLGGLVNLGADAVKVGRLFPGGAIFSTQDRVYEWRGGSTSTQLAFTDDLGYLLRVEGTWAVWSAGGTLWRRDLAAGTTFVVSTDMLTGNHDVAGNGDVAFTGANYQVYRWRDGVTTHVSNGLMGVSPRTDGTQVIWTSDTSIYLWRGGTPQLLTSVAITPSPPLFYDVNGGWAAYVKPSASGQGQVFTMAPDGTVRQVSPSSGEARIEAVGPDGAVVYIQPFGAVSPRRWLSEPPYTARTDVGGYIGEVRFIGDDPYFFVGRSAFRVNR